MQLYKKALNFLKVLIRPYNKRHFINQIEDGSSVLDIGCGNNSVVRIKELKPNTIYTGVDVGDYNQSDTSKTLCQKYLICPPEKFAETIASLTGSYRYLICTHNLEHCNQPYETLEALVSRAAKRSEIFIAFPSASTIKFPNRKGTLNFRDDPTHNEVIDSAKVRLILANSGFTEFYVSLRYRSICMVAIGLLLEPISALLGKNMPGTWELYGFESVIWCKRN